MPASKQTYIMGERFWLVKEGLTRTGAVKIGRKEREEGYKARVVKIARGNYRVWSTRPFAYLTVDR